MQNINMTGGITRIFLFQTFYGMFNSQICKIYQARRMAASYEEDEIVTSINLTLKFKLNNVDPIKLKYLGTCSVVFWVASTSII